MAVFAQPLILHTSTPKAIILKGPLVIDCGAYLFLPRGCVDRVHALRQVTAVFHPRAVTGADTVGLLASADPPFSAVDRIYS